MLENIRNSAVLISTGIDLYSAYRKHRLVGKVIRTVNNNRVIHAVNQIIGKR